MYMIHVVQSRSLQGTILSVNVLGFSAWQLHKFTNMDFSLCVYVDECITVISNTDLV